MTKRAFTIPCRVDPPPQEDEEPAPLVSSEYEPLEQLEGSDQEQEQQRPRGLTNIQRASLCAAPLLGLAFGCLGFAFFFPRLQGDAVSGHGLFKTAEKAERQAVVF